MYAKGVSYGHFSLSSTNCTADKKYPLLIGQSEQFIKAKLHLQHKMVDTYTRIHLCQFDIYDIFSERQIRVTTNFQASKAEVKGDPCMVSFYINVVFDLRVFCLNVDDDSESGERLKVQQKEAARKENTLVHRLTLKEQELQDYVVR